MYNSVKSRSYWLRIIPALLWQILYLSICNLFGKYTRVYCDLVFYLGIAVYFASWRDWHFKEWGKAIKKFRTFWLPVLLTALGMAVMFGIGIGIAMLFPHANDGMNVFGVNNWPTLIAFAFVTIFLPPIAEEVFYRKAMTAFDTKAILIITTVVSILLYASEHSFLPLGFLQACLWAIPLSMAYIKTKNIYVCMTAHFLVNFIVNGIAVISCIIKFAG
ncbi:MAG: CPBP family intramembrane metalloprotease [Clostridiales bacterium]|jgi:membrane protease YdiL (CAAX protease family)|nr:CPBP family intramembrane metalloprotease [Clostridiales bacterium]